MQFWQNGPKFHSKTPTISFSDPVIDNQFYLLTKSHKTALQTQNAVLTIVQKNCRQKLNSYSIEVQNDQKKSCFRENFVSFFKMILRTGRMHLWRTCGALPPKVQHFLCKVQMLSQSSYTFQRTTIFHQSLSVHVNYNFVNFAKMFQLNKEEFYSENIEFDEKTFKLLEKNVKLYSRNRKRSHYNIAEPRLSVVKIFFSPSPKAYEKLVSFDRLVSRQTDPSEKECSFDKIAKSFTPKFQQNLAQISKKINNINCCKRVTK